MMYSLPVFVVAVVILICSSKLSTCNSDLPHEGTHSIQSNETCSVRTYQKIKWCYWFHSLDVNHGDLISIVNRDLTRHAFMDVFGLNATNLKMEDLTYWWDGLILHGKYGNVSMSEFSNDLTSHFLDDKPDFIRQVYAFERLIWEIIDANNDQFISEIEWNNGALIYSHNHTEVNTGAFNAFSQGSERIAVMEIAKEWTDFIANETDSENGDKM